MAVSKVIYGNTTVIDITDSTVNANNLLSGNKAYGADGEPVFGALSVGSTINVTTSDVELFGETLTLSKDSTTLTTTFDNSGEATFTSVLLTGTLTLTCGEFTNTISVPTYDTYNVEFTTVPNGKVVTPTDNIQIWLACAGIKDKLYTTLTEVLADRETFETLITDSNACDYMARSTTWTLAEGAVPTMTDYTTPSGVVTYSTIYSAGYEAYKAFDNDDTTSWSTSQEGRTNAWVAYQFVNAVCINAVKIMPWSGTNSSDCRIKNFKIQASNDNFTNDIHDLYTGIWNDFSSDTHYFSFDNTNSYTSYRLFVIDNYTSASTNIKTLQFYEADITRNQDAMSLIGKYDYCSNELLSNATWAEAIGNSDYFEEVLNVKVPVMTSNTTPSGVGEVIYSTYSSGQEPYKAFDNNSSTTWSPSGQILPSWIGFHFDNPIKVFKASVRQRIYSTYAGVTETATIQGSNTGNSDDWHDVSDAKTFTVMVASNPQWIDFDVDGSIAYEYYRMNVTATSNPNVFATCSDLQFYGRAEKAIYSPKVPTMTSDTQPSGEAVGSTADSGLQLYRMFNKNSMDCYSTAPNTPTTGFYAGYKFDTATVINKLSIMTTFWHTNSSSAYYDLGIYGGDSLDNLTKLSTTNLRFTSTTSLTAQTTQELTFDNDTAYLYYVLKFESASSGIDYMKLQSTYIFMIWELQFYSKASATNLVHSCANDTLYYYDLNNTAVTLCTTDENGDGIIDYGSLDAGYYTIYSTVAKDPSNLANAYSKTVRITNTPYGHTTEAYIMPDAVKTLYWWGYIDDSRIEECTVANGWAANSYGATFNTNDIRLYSASVSQIMGIGTKNAINMSDYTKLTVINNGIALNGGTYAQCGCNATKVTNTDNIGSYTTAGVNKKEWDISSKTGNQYLTIACNANTRDLKILAIILE